MLVKYLFQVPSIIVDEYPDIKTCTLWKNPTWWSN